MLLMGFLLSDVTICFKNAKIPIGIATNHVVATSVDAIMNFFTLNLLFSLLITPHRVIKNIIVTISPDKYINNIWVPN